MTGAVPAAVESADREELGPALSAKLVAAKLGAAVQLLNQCTLQSANRGLGIAMRTAQRLVDDPVDNAECLLVLRRDLHRFGSFWGLIGGAPQDRGAALRRDHGIDGMLEHQDAIGAGYRHGSAGAALADDDGD